MNIKHLFVLTFISALLLCSCGAGRTNSVGANSGDTVKLKYARLLTIVKHDHFSEVLVADPWHKGNTLHKYILVPRNEKMPNDLPNGTIVRTPLKKSIVFTSAHCFLLASLNGLDGIAGVCDAQYILDKQVKTLISKGKIADCGNGMSPVVEKIINIKANGMLISPFENSGGYGKLEEIGIPIIECADYMESTALGRAEWMKLYGMIYGREHEADSLFAVVDSSYNALKTKAKNMPKGLSIITERKTGSTWYMPGGESTMGQIIKDANGTYAFANDKNSGSLALSPEQVLAKVSDADVWVFKYEGDRMLSREDLLSEYHGYATLKSFKTGNIYECNSTKIPYFDEVPFRPDFLLRELIILLHPEVKGNLRYYSKL
ncbi:MAG: ABC transporter substrate-binding protein [Prevotella sp.]|nr:ABC transporter substrate-binding protein [Prevotella sp.]